MIFKAGGWMKSFLECVGKEERSDAEGFSATDGNLETEVLDSACPWKLNYGP